MAYNYSRLRVKIKEVYRTETAFAAALQITHVSLSDKLNNKFPFKLKEIEKTKKLLKISSVEIPEYFFTKEEKK